MVEIFFKKIALLQRLILVQKRILQVDKVHSGISLRQFAISRIEDNSRAPFFVARYISPAKLSDLDTIRQQHLLGVLGCSNRKTTLPRDSLDRLFSPVIAAVLIDGAESLWTDPASSARASSRLPRDITCPIPL